MKYSIAMKIFTLAVGIMLTTFIVAIITNIEVIGIGRDVKFNGNIILPLASESAALNETGLRRRIAFERLFREYGETKPDSKVIEEAENNIKMFTAKVEDHIKNLRSYLLTLPKDPERQELFSNIRELVSLIESIFDHQSEMARLILEKRRAGKNDEVKELFEFNSKAQADLQEYRDRLQSNVNELARISNIRTQNGQVRILWSSLATTLLAIVLGVYVSWMISRNIARPILELLKTTKAVQGGDLTGHAGKLPEDEIGELGTGFNSMVGELRRKQDLQRAIGSYIDPRIVEKVILPGRPEDVAGQKRVMTILFTDMVGFTTIGENLTPSGLVNVINRYLTLMTECVHAENGIVDKFIGDAVMAYWGPPFVPEEEQAAAACRTALRQIEAMTRFRAELPELMGMRKNLPHIDIRIGMATGDVVVGNIGSNNARSYTVIGDVVNLASRLESTNKLYGTHILMSDETKQMAERLIETREIDLIAVKGKSEPVRVYELISLQGQLPPDWEEKRMRFSEGINAYRQQDWPNAKAIFQELEQKYADGPSVAFLERINQFEKLPKDIHWDGSWQMTTK
jgi:adenylate cyclase